ncbi:hypothetical protein K2173_019329 [Erythroxylum novogranatense]|uniref:Gnk2-homologous domain-containing protein n=1 Tax=Erythroxylum novogranatense TaxID=1862640 RepID=A0AAV8STC6_9ROSI|nr:hypothetical protein K2173_019329 [Erythroxylum novogranatense]
MAKNVFLKICYNILFLLSFNPLLHLVVGFEVISSSCFKPDFKAKSPFEANLNKLISSLSYWTPDIGYGRDSIGEGTDAVHGIAVCRADMNHDDCRTCVDGAGKEIRKRCSLNGGGIIWYASCMLKYSKSKFFSQIDLENQVHGCSPNKVPYPIALVREKRKLFRWLIKGASKNEKFFAAGNMKVGLANPIYGFVQCSRDLSSVDCKKCLKKARRMLKTTCRTKACGFVFTGSCMIKYDSNPFIND